MTATRIIDDHIELANIGTKTHAEIESHIQGIGNYAFPAADGSANQILETDGADVLSWVDKPAGFACADLNACNLTDIGTRAHSSLTGIGASDHHVKFTDQNAVDACDVSNIFLERNVENTVTAGTTLKRTTSGNILNFKASVASLGVVIEPADLILESTTHIFNQMFIQATYPQIKAIDKDGVTKIIGYQKTAKGYGSNSTWMEYAVLNSAGALVPGFQINYDSVNLIGHQIQNVADPTGAQHAATKNYHDTNKYTDAEARAAINDIFGSDGKADADVDLDNHVIKNITNHVHSALSGTKKLIELDISGVPYYFEVYPTKA